MKKCIRDTLGFSLIIASAFVLGCRNNSESEIKTRNKTSAYTFFKDKNLQPKHKTLKDKFSEETEKILPKPELAPYEKFRQEKLGERYDSLCEIDKQYFDRVYGPKDWKLLDEIYESPSCFIEKLSKELNSSDLKERYLKFSETRMNDLSEDLKKEIRKIIPVINFNRPDEFDITTAFYFIELRRALYGEDFGIRK